MNYIVKIIFLFQFVTYCFTQRVAPGVPPQHYEQYQVHPQQMPQQVPVHQQGQHMPQQQMHQQQIHQQQIQQQQMQQQQMQQQQMQQQQMQQQQMQQPIHQQQGHMHHAQHPQQGQLLNTANIAHEKEHIAEHMEVPLDTSKMTEQELQFHYFKMHDADNNNKLDGCELIKSLIHWHEQGKGGQHGGQHGNQQHEEKIFKDEELVALIDPILGMDDSNSDGFIDYPEFVRAQQKAAQGVKT